MSSGIGRMPVIFLLCHRLKVVSENEKSTLMTRGRFTEQLTTALGMNPAGNGKPGLNKTGKVNVSLQAEKFSPAAGRCAHY